MSADLEASMIRVHVSKSLAPCGSVWAMHLSRAIMLFHHVVSRHAPVNPAWRVAKVHREVWSNSFVPQ